MKAGQLRVGTSVAIRELREDVRLRCRQVAAPKGLFRRALRRALDLP
jgi:hypothetical protein